MHSRILDILACPVCLAHPFSLSVLEGCGDQITTGSLRCSSCGRIYSIASGIPRLLVPDEALADAMATRSAHCGSVAPDSIGMLLREHICVRAANMEYYDQTSDLYHADVNVRHFLAEEASQERIRMLLRELADASAPGYLLDIGCGTGNILERSQGIFEQGLGVDASLGMLQIAHSKGFDVAQADLLFLPVRNVSVSVASAYSVLHHIYDPLSALVEWSRVTTSSLYTDWDPQKHPDVSKNLPFRLLRGANHSLSKVSGLLIANQADGAQHSAGFNPMRDLRDNNLRGAYKVAEYHEQSEQRGIEVAAVLETLSESGFSAVQARYHSGGTRLDELPLRTRLAIGVKALLTRHPVDHWMENFAVVAWK